MKCSNAFIHVNQCLLFKIFEIPALNKHNGRKVFKHVLLLHLQVIFISFLLSTAEAVLQKMDDMKKMRRQRMRKLEDLGMFNKTEEVNIFFR